ncbi:MAG: D-aminoacyl-tRNA deacylase [Candidatus Micrarchaeota archaeon]
MILLFTSNNLASANIAKKLMEEHGFRPGGEDEWTRGMLRMIDTHAPTVLDVPTGFDTDCLLVLSTHRSKREGKALTAHVPGNWGAADMGGEPKTLNIAPAGRLKALMQELRKEADRIGWDSSLEADHHGPTCQVPIMFVEIGNGEKEWADEEAAAAVANAVMASAKRESGNPETVFGVGGGHYPRDFTKVVIESDLAVGHIAPKYAIDSLDAGMFRQAMERNVEKVSRVLISKDETNGAQKEKIRRLAEDYGAKAELI